MTLTTDKHIVVLYHADCADGFGAAWAAWKKFGASADYVPVTYNDTFPTGLEDKEVYLLDFCYDDAAVVANLSNVVRKLVIIDHHKSQEHIVNSVPGSLFDPNLSGAVLSWNYFNPGSPVPKMLQLIQDRDLWKFELADTMEINTTMDAAPRNFPSWGLMAEELENKGHQDAYAERGKAILQYQQIILDSIVKNNSQRVLFEGHEIYAVNAPRWFASILGDMLYKKLPPMAIVWSQLSDINAVSIRSDQSIDVSQIAKKFGGGGHSGSAGFKVALVKPLPWKVIHESR